MEKTFNYTYVTTNLINGKKYIGDHSTDNLDDGYLGSGNLFTKKVNEYGRENFKKEIIEFFDTKQAAFDAQEKWINQYDTLVPNGYNISPKGGHNVSGCWNEISLEKKRKSVKKFYDEHPEIVEDIRQKLIGIKRSNKTKRILSESKKGEKNPMYGKSSPRKGAQLSKDQKEKLSNLYKGKTYEERYGKKKAKEIREKLKGASSHMKGKKHSEVSREKMSKSHIGIKRSPFSDEHKEKIRQSNLGKKHSQETIEKLKEIQKGPRPYRRCMYILTSPEGIKYEIETRKKVYEFIAEHRLSQRKIMANINKGVIIEKNFNYLKETSKKTLGWKIQKN